MIIAKAPSLLEWLSYKAVSVSLRSLLRKQRQEGHKFQGLEACTETDT